MTALGRYILSLAGASSLLTVLLAYFGVKRLDIYFSLYLIAYLVITLVYSYLSPQVRGLLVWVVLALFAVFATIILIRAATVLVYSR